MSTERTAAEVKASLRKKLIRLAHDNPEMRPALFPKIERLASPTMRVAGMDLPTHIALDLQAARMAAAPFQDLKRLPGFSGMQLRQEVDRLGALQREIKMMEAQLGEALKKLKGLEKEEKAGLAGLKKAAREMKTKGNFVAEAETALLKFGVSFSEKRPGIEQMIADADSKFGEKAGDFFGRVGDRLGDEVAKAVQDIYEETKEDLTHTATAIRALKIVQKTAHLNQAIVKQAGLGDAVLQVKEWLAGKARRLMDFMGDIGRWVKGFVERTKVVKKSKDNILKAISKAEGDIDKALKSY